MVSQAVEQIWTIERLEGLDDNGARYELLRGKLIEVPGPEYQHWYIIGRLLRLLGNFVDVHKLGAVGTNGAFMLRRNPDTLLIPDVAYVQANRTPPNDADWDIYIGAPVCV